MDPTFVPLFVQPTIPPYIHILRRKIESFILDICSNPFPRDDNVPNCQDNNQHNLPQINNINLPQIHDIIEFVHKNLSPFYDSDYNSMSDNHVDITSITNYDVILDVLNELCNNGQILQINSQFYITYQYFVILKLGQFDRVLEVQPSLCDENNAITNNIMKNDSIDMNQMVITSSNFRSLHPQDDQTTPPFTQQQNDEDTSDDSDNNLNYMAKVDNIIQSFFKS